MYCTHDGVVQTNEFPCAIIDKTNTQTSLLRLQKLYNEEPKQMCYLLSRLRDLCERWLLPLSLSALRLLFLRDGLWEELLLERRLLLKCTDTRSWFNFLPILPTVKLKLQGEVFLQSKSCWIRFDSLCTFVSALEETQLWVKSHTTTESISHEVEGKTLHGFNLFHK